VRTLPLATFVVACLVGLGALASQASAACGGSVSTSCLKGIEQYGGELAAEADSMAYGEAANAAALGPCLLAAVALDSIETCAIYHGTGVPYYPFVFAQQASVTAGEAALWLLF
jgi:hypothetical protein